MSDYINLPQEECNPLCQKITALHQRQAKAARDMSAGFRTLLEDAQGFHADRISGYVTGLLNLADQEIISRMEKQFAETEAALSRFFGSIQSTDRY